MKVPRRWAAWVLILGITGGLVALGRGSDTPNQTVVEPVARTTAAHLPGQRTAEPHKGSNDSESVMILPIRERGPLIQAADSFAPHEWSPPPPPPPKPAPTPAPVAPPIPYAVLGKQAADGVWQVFLGRQDQVFIVKQGDTLESSYRIEEIKPPALTLTYVPLNQRQVLAIGGNE